MDSQCTMVEQMLLEAYFDIIPFHIYVVDVATYEILFLNKKMRNKSKDVNLLQTCHKAIYGVDAPCPHCKMASLLDKSGQPNGTVVTYEYYNEFEECWYQMHEKALAWPDGRIVKYTIAVDISEQKRTQNQLAEAHAELALRAKGLQKRNDLLQENVRLREDMERMLHHDLKSPLGPVLFLPDVLRESHPDLPGEVQDGLALLARCGTEMLEMINHSQSMILLERGEYELDPEQFDVVDMLARVAAIFSPLAASIRVSIVLPQAADLAGDELQISGEKLLCHSMFSNLLKNALEASSEGDVVTLLAQGSEDAVTISIVNKGEVPRSVRSRFFEKYATSGKPDGVGLGTYSADLITRAHGGKLELDTSTAGQTTVSIRLPRKA